MALIDVGIVNVALPSIQHSLDATPSDLQWILSGYTLTFGVVLIAAGRAGDILGRGGLFILGLLVFTISSLVASLAPTPGWLNGARLVEGIGAGFISPQVYGLIQDHFHGPARGRAFGYLGMATSFAVAVAPTLGGFLIMLGGHEWGWRLTFLVNVPLGVIGLVLAWVWFPKPLFRFDRRPGSPGAIQTGLVRSLDLVGSLLAGLAVLMVLLPFVEFRTSELAWLSLPVGAILIASWVGWERHYARCGHLPMVDLRLFSIHSLSNGLTIQVLYFLGMTSVWVLIVLYVQEGSGRSALETGLLGMPAAFISAFAARWAGRRVVRIGRKMVIAGQAVTVVGLGLSILVIMLQAADSISIWWLIATLSVFGIGQGLTISPNQTLTLQNAPAEYAGSAGALLSTSQRIGSSVGIALVTAAVFVTLPHASWAIATNAGFALVILIILVSIGVSCKDLKDHKLSRNDRASEHARK